MSASEAMVYRRAKDADVDEIVRLWTGMMAEHSRFDPRIRLTGLAPDAYAAYLAYHLESPDSFCLAAEAPGHGGVRPPNEKARLAAYCLAFVSTNLAMFEPRSFGYVSDIVVDEGLRGRGIGTELLAQTKAWMRAKGVKAIQLQTYSKNRAGKAFWAGQGFTGFYDRLWLDLE